VARTNTRTRKRTHTHTRTHTIQAQLHTASSKASKRRSVLQHSQLIRTDSAPGGIKRRAQLRSVPPVVCFLTLSPGHTRHTRTPNTFSAFTALNHNTFSGFNKLTTYPQQVPNDSAGRSSEDTAIEARRPHTSRTRSQTAAATNAELQKR